MDMTVNPFAVVAAAVSMFLIGGLWYSALFAKQWQRAAGVSDAALKTGAVRVFVGSFVLSLVIAASLAAFVGEASIGFAVVAALAAGLTFVTATLGILYLFERRSLALAAINGGYVVVAFAVMGVIIGALQ